MTETVTDTVTVWESNARGGKKLLRFYRVDLEVIMAGWAHLNFKGQLYG
jgi:hypothetical protein